tara:strand:- start:182 stop:1162 length:981 start_codon:yes stop_codon:yes gene_type:complete
MKRTEVNILSDFSNLEVKEKFLFVGSCFSENIGQKFKDLHLDTFINPFGVIFHPIPLFQLFDRALTDSLFEPNDFFEFQDYWFNYQISGSCAKFDKNEAVDFANKKLKELKSEIASADRLFLTFGSSVLRRIKDKPVANCHKQFSKLFKKEISTSSEILEYVRPILEKIFNINRSINISLSVSPVRHSKEGMVENSLSKSNLVILCNELKLIFDNIEYLPIYEFVIDELRDYSFFNEDLVHPNNLTIEMVWQKLKKGVGSNKFIDFCNQSEQLLLSINHKSLYPKSKQNMLFLNNLLASINKHESKYDVNWSLEKEIVRNKLKIMA